MNFTKFCSTIVEPSIDGWVHLVGESNYEIFLFIKSSCDLESIFSSVSVRDLRILFSKVISRFSELL